MPLLTQWPRSLPVIASGEAVQKRAVSMSRIPHAVLQIIGSRKMMLIRKLLEEYLDSLGWCLVAVAIVWSITRAHENRRKRV